jgi:hypothetical protein
VSDTPRDCIHGRLARSCEQCQAEREIADLERENARLREIEHYVWHVLESSEERADANEVVIDSTDQDYLKLVELVGEQHPAAEPDLRAERAICECVAMMMKEKGNG